jgi:hypothetical protein
MKLAWLCYPRKYEDDEEEEPEPIIKFEEPVRYFYERVVMIVYAEVEKT